MRFTILLLLLGLLPAAAQRPTATNLRERTAPTMAPYVSSPQPVVDRMLELAALKPGEVVYDLGCGDGRIVIAAARKYRTRGIGVELSQKLVESTSEEVKRLNLADLVVIRQGHLLDVNLSDADVVMIYLDTGSNEMLRPNLEKFLKPGSRVVSHDFEVRGWKPVKVDKLFAFHREHAIYLYQIPISVKPSRSAPKTSFAPR